MRKTVPASSERSSEKAINNVSERTSVNRGVSTDANNQHHDVGTSASTSANKHNHRDRARDNSGLVAEELSTTNDRPIDKHLHNNLSPDLSTALYNGGFAESPANREKQSVCGVGNSNGNTALQQCVVAELEKYFAMLEGHPPNDLYKLVIAQVETALFGYVLEACGNNQSRAAEYLGVSRGTLRNRIVDLSLD